ncbi:MAG: hypothetical protein INR71_05400 [Terriglobus roseus]|nr:hypothetical protein [Terriglobus roseus]
MCVDFPQALTGLDYLKDLETRRRREVSGAMARLGVNRTALESDSLALEEFPSVRPWLKTIEAKEHKIDALYTQLYVGLRRWIIINELSLLPFHKHNCVAMLNTLYPPMRSTPPTSKLSHEVLKAQREGFFKYINMVEKYGPQVLGKLMQQGAAAGDDNGWVAVTRSLNQYLQLAMSIIYDCSEIVDAEDLEPKKAETSSPERPTRKADSGISFTSNIDIRRPSSQGSSKDGGSIDMGRPKTSSGPKTGTTLEKLARGLRTLGRTKVDATEIISDTASVDPPTTSKAHGLRKMRSMGALDRSSKNAAKAGAIPSFDADEMRRQRLRYEANVMAEQKFGRHPHH